MSTLDHLETMFAEAYQRELDHEENIWRSLPFFAATLTLVSAAAYQVLGRLPEVRGQARWLALFGLAAASATTVAAIGFTLGMIFRASFAYIAPETDFLGYRDVLEQSRRELAEEAGALTIDPLEELKEVLVQQYAAAVAYNRALNQRRNQCRTVAGICTVLAVLATLLLVGAVFWHSVQVMLARSADVPV